MRPCRRPIVGCVVSWLIAVGAALASRADAARDPHWPQLPGAGWTLDSTRIAHVGSVLLERDAGSLLLEDGRIGLAHALDGRHVALVFAGRGTFAFTPRGGIEKEQLRRFLGVPALRRSFRSALIVATDSTFDELLPGLALGPDTMRTLATRTESSPQLEFGSSGHPCGTLAGVAARARTAGAAPAAHDACAPASAPASDTARARRHGFTWALLQWT